MIREILVPNSFPAIGPGHRRDDFVAARDLVESVQQVAYLLSYRFVRDAEMPQPLIHVSRINYFVTIALQDHWAVLFGDEQSAKILRSDLVAAFEAVGAQEHANLVHEVGIFSIAASRQFVIRERAHEACMDELSNLKRKRLTGPKLELRYPSLRGKWHALLDDLHDPYWCAPIFLCARYIDGLEIVRQVADANYLTELDRAAATIPDIAERRRAYEASREWEKKAIERIMKTEESTTHYTQFGVRNWEGRSVWEWNFSVPIDSCWRLHRAIFVDGEIIIFESEADRIIARADAQECAHGSKVVSNAPPERPDSLGFNLRYIIGNR
jgi:hypothetical protein